jgi:hypothetical protein
LRRVPWRNARFDGETLVLPCGPAEFERLEVIEKDLWPAR